VVACIVPIDVLRVKTLTGAPVWSTMASIEYSAMRCRGESA